MISVRKALSGDESGIYELLGQVLAVHNAARPDLFCPSGSKYTRQELTDIFNDEKRPVFVAVDSHGKIIGHEFCILEDHNGPSDTPHRTLYIDDLCIDEDHRGQHIGRLLYEYASEYAIQQNCYNITLHVWEGNDNAKAFYDSLGMKPYMTGMESILMPSMTAADT